MGKQKPKGWLDKFDSTVVKSDATSRPTPGPVFLGNPYAKEMAKRQTYISPYDAKQKASPAMQQVFAEKADAQAKKKRIRNFLEEQQDVLGKAEMLSLIPTPFTEVVGGAAGLTNAAISAALAGQDFSEGNYASALGNFGAGALGVGAGSIGMRGGLNNVIDDLLPTKGPKNFMTGKPMSSTPGTLGTLKPLEPHQEIGFHAIGDFDYVSDRELKEAYEEALDKFQLTNYRPNVDPFLDHDVEKALALNVRMKFADRLPKFTNNNYTAAVHAEDPLFFDGRGPYSERFFNQQGYDLSKLDPQEKALMSAYQHGYDAYFNKRPSVHKLPTTLKDYFGELSDQFNTAVQKNKINKDITLNRSVGDYVLDYWDPVANKSLGRGLRSELQVGDVYKDAGFMSTSLPHYDYGIGKFKDKIIVPGGGIQSYAFPNATSYGQFMGEQEVILPKGLIRRVEDVPEPGQVITSILNPYKNGGELDKYEPGGNVAKTDATRVAAPALKLTKAQLEKNKAINKQVMAQTNKAKAEEIARRTAARNKPGKTISEVFTSKDPYNIQERFRLFPGDTEYGQVFDEYFNPAYFTAQMASDLGNSLQSGDYKGAATTAGLALGVGALGFDPLGSAMKVPGKVAQSMESGLLSNTHKINPWAFKPTEGMMYRGLGEEGFKDALESGVFRAKQNVEPFMSGKFNIAKSFGTNPYFTPRFKTAESYGSKYLAEVPESAANWRQRYKRTDWSQVADRAIPINEGRILQKDWLQGYKPVEMPKASSIDDVTGGLTEIAQPINQPWQLQELPGLHLKSTMEGEAISKIIEPKTGLINVEQALGIIGKESGGADKVAIIKQGLGKNLPKKMDYNEFRKVVQDQLIPLDRKFTTHASNYGIENLGYLSKLQGNALEKLREFLLTDVRDLGKGRLLENETLLLSNEGQFGKGSAAHRNPKETLGHAHFLRQSESPDVLTVTQIQSDAFQGPHRVMPKSSEEAFTKLNRVKDNAKDILESFGDEPDKFKDVINRVNRELNLEEAHVKNIDQKKLLDKSHQERYLQEIVDYAGKRGDLNKVRLPTAETAAKVQGYTPIKTSDQVLEEYSRLKGTPEFDEMMANTSDADKLRLEKILKGELKGDIYSLEHQTILKKYSEQPKTIKKLFGEEPNTVKDGQGNTWYEFDIPKKFKEGKGEIKAFGLTPALIGTGAAGAIGAAATSQQPEQQRNGGWLEKYNDGGPVQENYNDYSVSAPEGFVGEGFSNVGRNYSPAWGGQFEDGGEIPQLKPGGRVITKREDFEPWWNWASRQAGDLGHRQDAYGKVGDLYAYYAGQPLHYNVLEYSQYKPTNSKDPNAKYISINDPKFRQEIFDQYQNTFVKGDLKSGYPKKINDNTYAVSGYPPHDKKLAERAKKLNVRGLDLMRKEHTTSAIGHYYLSKGKDDKGEYISYYDVFDQGTGPNGGGVGETLGLTKPFEIYDRIYLDPKTGKPKMAMGGSMPGAVGFTYARTINPAPSNGPYAKKTKASAQNGIEMKYYQEGLDFRPKTISKNGSVIKDDRGQWAHPGEITEIGSNQITMQGVPYPVLGISDTGDTQMMYPNQDYTYHGSSVTEYPMMKEGGALQLIKLDQLTNFTNYNTKQPGGWLDKYQD